MSCFIKPVKCVEDRTNTTDTYSVNESLPKVKGSTEDDTANDILHHMTTYFAFENKRHDISTLVHEAYVTNDSHFGIDYFKLLAETSTL